MDVEKWNDRRRLLRQKEVLKLVPISAATLWRWVKAGTFPEPLKLGPKTTAWRELDIMGWLERG